MQQSDDMFVDEDTGSISDEYVATDCNIENLKIFQGLKFHLHGFKYYEEEQVVNRLQWSIERLCGEWVPSTFKGVVDYLLVPIDIREIQVKIKATHIVNCSWIYDAIRTQTIVNIAYFHKPFNWDESLTPLTGLPLVLTNYPFSEREYLRHVGFMLGATFVNMNWYVKNMILICPKPEGAMYNGAINWKLPVVSGDWLLACASAKRKVAMRPYLVGNSIVPADEEEDVELPSIDLDSTMDPSWSTQRTQTLIELQRQQIALSKKMVENQSTIISLLSKSLERRPI